MALMTTLAAGSRCLKSHQRLRNHRVLSFLFGPEISFSPSYKSSVQANGVVNFVLTRQHAGGLGVAFVKLTTGRQRPSIATEIPVNNAAGIVGIEYTVSMSLPLRHLLLRLLLTMGWPPRLRSNSTRRSLRWWRLLKVARMTSNSCSRLFDLST